MGNTGYKSFASLELYYTDDNSYAGTTKANVSTDPDYIAPILDTATCIPSARYYNTVRTLAATRNNCSSGYSGNSVTLTANANQFVSAISVADANAQADSWLAVNVQSYANTSGTCTLDNTITITNYSDSNLYFTISGAGYSPSAFTVNTSTTSSTGPWTNNTSGVTSPRSVGVPTVTTWYRIQDAITPSILSNVYQYIIAGDTPPTDPPPCLEYEVFGGTNGRTISFTNCAGQSQTMNIPAGDSINVCSRQAIGGATLLGSCPAPPVTATTISYHSLGGNPPEDQGSFTEGFEDPGYVTYYTDSAQTTQITKTFMGTHYHLGNIINAPCRSFTHYGIINVDNAEPC